MRLGSDSPIMKEIKITIDCSKRMDVRFVELTRGSNEEECVSKFISRGMVKNLEALCEEAGGPSLTTEIRKRLDPGPTPTADHFGS